MPLRFAIAFAGSMLVLCVAIVVAATLPKKRMAVITAATYAMLAIGLFPFGVGGEFLAEVQNMFVAVQKTTKIFTLGGDFMSDVAGRVDAPDLFMRIYCVWMSALYAAAPALAAGTLLSFSKTAMAFRKWIFSRAEETWIFSEPSEKALMFAENTRNDKAMGRICMVFCNATRDSYDQILDRGGVPLGRKIGALSRRYLNRRPASVFFMGEDDGANLEQGLDFIRRHRADGDSPVMLYLFSAGEEAELLLNAADKGRLKCRRIVERRALVYREIINLYRHRAAQPESARRDYQRVLLAGCGWIGMEMLKAMLWGSVAEPGRFVVDVVDRAEVRQRFLHECPGMKALSTDSYEIRFHECDDIHAFDLNAIPDASSIGFVFVALGSDSVNLECAIYLRQAFARLYSLTPDSAGRLQPEIHVVVANPSNKNLDFKDPSGKPYDIRPFVGSEGYYTPETLLGFELERQAIIEDLGWKANAIEKNLRSGTLTEKERRECEQTLAAIRAFMDDSAPIASHAEWRRRILSNAVFFDFYDVDYNCRSSRARAVFELCCDAIGYAPTREDEHDRWMLFMLTEGYQHGPEKNHIAKLHPDLKRDISEENRDKDMMAEENLRSAQSALKDAGQRAARGLGRPAQRRERT